MDYTGQPVALQHVYQATKDGALIIYTKKDILVLFSIMSVYAAKHKLRIAGLSFMPDHYHLGVVGLSRADVAGFERDITAVYTKEFNKSVEKRDGPLFRKPFGCSTKLGNKEIISMLNYIGNNAPVKKLCSNAENTFWNFLVYHQSSCFFAKDPVVIRNESAALKKAITELKGLKGRGRWITYGFLDRVFSNLSIEDQNKFCDYAICLYNFIDYDLAISYYGSFQNMITAMNSNTGKEFGINEQFDVKDDRGYYKAINYIMKSGSYADIKDIIGLPIDDIRKLGRQLLMRFDMNWRHIEKLCHLPDGTLYQKAYSKTRVKGYSRRVPENKKEA